MSTTAALPTSSTAQRPPAAVCASVHLRHANLPVPLPLPPQQTTTPGQQHQPGQHDPIARNHSSLLFPTTFQKHCRHHHCVELHTGY
ncbi:hypothetical protein CHU98_g4021 [Xylaria longipes]|nr:hypothetical protein CHU98_g4021 [Xylaria longipes]